MNVPTEWTTNNGFVEQRGHDTNTAEAEETVTTATG